MKPTITSILFGTAVITLVAAASREAAASAGTCAAGYHGSRERGVGTGPSWRGDPTDCRSIWRHGHYRGNDPDSGIRLQLMRGR